MKIPTFIFYLLLSGLMMASTASAIDNETCMDCHGDDSLSRASSDGVRDEISFDYKIFQYSIHNINGVTCTDCHQDIQELDFDNEVPHPAQLAPVNCAGCHEEQQQSFSMSVHSQASKKGLTMQCFACHGYHDVRPQEGKSVLERENKSCLKCHNPYRFHAWLPQKEAHFSFVECTACHAPNADRHIHLRFYDLVKQEFFQQATILDALGTEVDGIVPMFDKNEDGIISTDEFEDLMFVLKRRGIHATMHGELLSEHQSVIHQVTRGNSERICIDCHSPDSPFFEAVTLFFTSDDGTDEHITLERDVLESYAVNDFYIPNGTRVRELDLIGVLLVAGAGLGVGSHLLVRILTVPVRRKRKNNEDNH